MSFSHTFVVPSYNQADYIGLTIESLLKQDLPSSEILVSEDFSTDHTRRVLAGFGDRIRITQPPEHKGMAFNWNWGVSQAKTQWVSIMGADDLALPSFVATMRQAAAQAPHAVMIHADCDRIDADGNVTSTNRSLTAKPLVQPPDTFYRLLSANVIEIAANCFRRDAWEKAGGFETRLRLYGDWGLWIKLAALGDFVHVRKMIGLYRIGYRPTIGRQRLPDSLYDDSFVQCVLIPEVAKTMAGIDGNRLRSSSRRRFRAVLIETVSMVPPDERGFAVDLLRDWARTVGEERQLEAFAAGGTVSPGWHGSALRRTLRDLYRRLRPIRS